MHAASVKPVLIVSAAVVIGVIVGVFVLPTRSAAHAQRPAPEARLLTLLPAAIAGSQVTSAVMSPGGVLGMATAAGRAFVQPFPGRGAPQPGAGELVARGSIKTMTISADGSTLAGVGANGVVWIWRRGSFPVFALPPPEGSGGLADTLAGIALEPHGRALVLYNLANVDVYAPGQNAGSSTIPLAASYALSGSNLPVSPVFAAGAPSVALVTDSGRGIPVMQLGTGQVSYPLSDPYSGCFTCGAVEFSADWTRAALDLSGYVALWDPRSGQQLGDWLVPQRSSVAQFALSANGNALALGTNSGSVYVFDLHADRPPALIRAGRGAVQSLALSADGRLLLASAAKGRAAVWSIRY